MGVKMHPIKRPAPNIQISYMIEKFESNNRV